MATPGRTEGAALRRADDWRTDGVAELLEREPYLFDFFQAVRLLERYSAGGKPVGRFVKPSREVARFGAHPSLVFPGQRDSIDPAASRTSRRSSKSTSWA